MQALQATRPREALQRCKGGVDAAAASCALIAREAGASVEEAARAEEDFRARNPTYGGKQGGGGAAQQLLAEMRRNLRLYAQHLDSAAGSDTIVAGTLTSPETMLCLATIDKARQALDAERPRRDAGGGGAAPPTIDTAPLQAARAAHPPPSLPARIYRSPSDVWKSTLRNTPKEFFQS